MRQRRIWLLVATSLLLAAAITGLLWLRSMPHPLVLTREDLQREVGKSFPIEKQELIATIRLSDPQVILQEGSDRIGLGVDVSLEAPGIKRISGTVAVDGEVRYDSTAGALYLDSARLVRLEAPGLSQEDVRAAEPILSLLIASYLSRTAVYRIKAPARRRLKSVVVRNGRLIVTLVP